MQAVVNGGGGFLGVARFVGVFDAQNKFAAVMSREEPVEQAPCARRRCGGSRWAKERNERELRHSLQVILSEASL